MEQQRLTPEEQKLHEKVRQYLNHMSPENFRHMTRAGREWQRSEMAKEKATA